MDEIAQKLMNHLNPLKFSFFIIILLFSKFCCAQTHYGANFSYSLYAKEPKNLHGYQFMLNYDPQCFQWRKFNIYFDLGFSHFWMTKGPSRIVNIYSLAPVVHYTFKKYFCIHPYLEFSIGLAYLNHTRIDSRNLGMHFAFQDRMGVGIFVGEAEKFSLGLHAVHYSNAHLSGHNSGMTIPLELDIGYRFC